MKDRSIAAARVVERMRDESYEKATVVAGDPDQTEVMRNRYRSNIKELCDRADITRALDVDDTYLWDRSWRKFQYTQAQAPAVNKTFILGDFVASTWYQPQ